MELYVRVSLIKLGLNNVKSRRSSNMDCAAALTREDWNTRWEWDWTGAKRLPLRFKSRLWCSGLFSGFSSSIEGHLTELCLTAVKFARKRGNIALATRLLSQCSDGGQEEQQSKAFRQISLEGTLGEKWGPEVQIEKAKVLRAAGEDQSNTQVLLPMFLSLWFHCVSSEAFFF